MSNIYGSFNGSLKKDDNVLYYYHIIIPADIVSTLKKENVKRFIVLLGDSSEFHAGMISNGKGDYFIIINQSLRTKYNLSAGDSIEVVLSKDTSDYGMPLPEEMAELFAQDPVGDKYFHALTPGKQRGLLYVVNKLKSPDKRIEKAVIIMEHLHEQHGKLDYKILQQDFKNKKGRI